MPNTEPVNDTAGITRAILEKARAEGAVRVYPIGAITRGQKGEELAEYGDLKEAGCVAFSDDGRPVASARVMRRALEYAKAFDLVVIDHCEEPTLAEKAVHERGARSRPSSACAASPRRARRSWSSATCCSPSSPAGGSTSPTSRAAASVDAVRRGKARGVRVTAEATPHHLLLTDEAVRETDYDTAHQDEPAPALRGRPAGAWWPGSATAPSTASPPTTPPTPWTTRRSSTTRPRSASWASRPRWRSASTGWSAPGLVELPHLVALLSTNPARVLGLPGGTLAPGSPADVTVLDLAKKRQVDPARFESKGRNTPFGGWILKGWPAMTIVGGRVAWKDAR